MQASRGSVDIAFPGNRDELSELTRVSHRPSMGDAAVSAQAPIAPRCPTRLRLSITPLKSRPLDIVILTGIQRASRLIPFRITLGQIGVGHGQDPMTHSSCARATADLAVRSIARSIGIGETFSHTELRGPKEDFTVKQRSCSIESRVLTCARCDCYGGYARLPTHNSPLPASCSIQLIKQAAPFPSASWGSPSSGR